MTSRSVFLAAIAAIVTLVAAGCGGEADPADAANGTWKTNEGWYLEFRDDGTFGFGGSVERIETDPLEWGTFTFDGETLRLVTAEDSIYCTGTDGVYEVESSEDGDELALELIEDECLARGSDLRRGLARYP